MSGSFAKTIQSASRAESSTAIKAHARLHRMVHADKGFSAATCELLLLHVDFRSRKSAPWPDACTERIDGMLAAHRATPDTDRAEHRLGIRPSRRVAA